MDDQKQPEGKVELYISGKSAGKTFYWNGNVFTLNDSETVFFNSYDVAKEELTKAYSWANDNNAKGEYNVVKKA